MSKLIHVKQFFVPSVNLHPFSRAASVVLTPCLARYKKLHHGGRLMLSVRELESIKSPGNGTYGFPASKVTAALLATIMCITFYAFGSNTLIGDGLRHLPALRTITPGAAPRFEPKPWLEVYRNHYDQMIVQHHFLFAITMRAAFAFQQEIGISRDAIVAMRAVNALSAAIAAALFFLIAVRVGVSQWMSVALTLGVCLSNAYLLTATNVAEAALSLPFFVGTLLLLVDRPFTGWTPVAAGVLVAFAALAYLLAGSLVPCILVATIATRFPSRPAPRPLLSFLSIFSLVFLGIWLTVLFAGGFHTPDRLVRGILRSPFEQGTYGKFKLGSFVATPVGLTEAFVPVLPDDFRGLRFLYRETPFTALYVGAATIVLCTFLTWLFYILFKQVKLRSPVALCSLLAFLLVEAICLEWDPYYLKLQIFGLILCWVMVIFAFATPQIGNKRWLFFLFVSLVVANGLWVLRNNIRPSQPRRNAEQLYWTVGDGVLITGWSSDVAQMWLYSNGDNIIPLPDFALTRNLKSSRVQEDLEAIIRQTTAGGRNVYFYGLFDEGNGGTTDIYETRFQLAGFTDYLRSLQRRARPIARLPQPGGHSVLLYTYVP